MFEICFTTTLSDPQGALLPCARRLWPALTPRFGAFAAYVTSDTDPAWFEFLESRDVAFQIAAPGTEGVGEQRRQALAVALANAAPRFLLFGDLAQTLRWLDREPDDLDRVVRHLPRWDCLAIGRSDAALQAEPAGIRNADALVNHTLALLTGRPWDLAAGVRGLSRHAARLILDHCDEPTVGTDVAWPLLCEIHGLSVGYCEAHGTASGMAPDGFDLDPTAWAARVRTAAQRLEAMAPFVDYYQSAQPAVPAAMCRAAID